MSFVTARFIFVFLLVLNAVTLSRSRYGQVSDVSLLHGENSLVKRISLELRNLAVSTEEPPTDEVISCLFAMLMYNGVLSVVQLPFRS